MMKKYLAAPICLFLLLTGFTSCVTTGKGSAKLPVSPSEVPSFSTDGRALKVEAENMKFSECTPKADEDASRGFCLEMKKKSASAEATVTLGAGRWEILIAEKAFETDKSFMTLMCGKDGYRIYPSNPPLGCFELTTRCPVYLDLKESQDIKIKVTPFQEKDKCLFSFDYIQFVKVKDIAGN